LPYVLGICTVDLISNHIVYIYRVYIIIILNDYNLIYACAHISV